VLVGVSATDGSAQADWLVEKVANLRIFADQAGKMNRSLADISGAALVVSQFTLYGDARKGRRPSFIKAAQGEEAERVYEAVAKGFADQGIEVATGEFGAMMQIELVNDGPVTILLDSERTF
jgi:D-aminoacyl-tRNA deacylase